MAEKSVFQKKLKHDPSGPAFYQMLRLILAGQPIGRSELSERLGVEKTAINEFVKPLIKAGVLIESADPGLPGKSRGLAFKLDGAYFIGVNIGARTTQIGMTDLSGKIREIEEFATHADPAATFAQARELIEEVFEERGRENCLLIGVCVPGLPDVERRGVVYAPNLKWRDVDIAAGLGIDGIEVVVENDSTAAALYEARLKIRDHHDEEAANFVLVRSGTGIGVGLVINGEVHRGTGAARGLAGEFGHMTIVAGGRPCVCGNRGCWERYGSAASAASLYLGDRPLRPNESLPRFAEIVSKAENGEIRAQRSLEKIGDYLGIGIANVVLGIGITRVIVSGRLVFGWKFIERPMRDAISRSIVGSIEGWSVEAGEPVGATIGGALEAAIDEYLRRGESKSQNRER